MNRSKKLFKNTIIYFIGNIGSKFLIFIMLPIYSIYLKPDEFGLIDLLLSIIPLLSPIVSCQIFEAVFRFLCTSRLLNIKKQFITTSFIFLIVSIFFVNLFLNLFLNFKFDVLFCLFFTMSQFFLYFSQVARGLKYNAIYAFSGIISAFIQAVICVAIIKNFAGSAIFISGIIGFLISSLFIIFKINFFSYVRLKSFNSKILLLLLSFGVPLIPNQISWWFNSAIGKYIATYFSGLNIAGMLAISTRLPNLIAVLNGVFLLAWTESIIEEFKKQDSAIYFSKGLGFFIKMQFVIIALILPITKLYYIVFIDSYYLNSSKIVPLLYCAGAFTGISAFLGTIYTASLQTKKAFYTTIFPAVLNTILSLILIPFCDILGLAISMFISSFSFFTIRYFSCKKILNYKINIKFFINDIIILLFSLIIFYLNNVSYILLCCLILYLLILVLNFRYLLTLRDLIFKRTLSF